VAYSVTWLLDGESINLSEDTTILGININQKMKATTHIRNRIRSCNQSVFKYTSAGLSYPGIHCEVKTLIRNAINAPVLTYGLETLNLTNSEMKN